MIIKRPADCARPKRTDAFRAVLAIVILAALLSGCAVGPDYQRPDTDLPSQWSGSGQSAAAEPHAVIDEGALATWWLVFDDATLSSLVQRAEAANLDLKLAEARIRQARAARGVAAGGLGPTLSASGSYRRSGSGTRTASGQTAAVTDDQYHLVP